MYGAMLGDMIGCPYEFDRGSKCKDFPLFCKGSEFTDDSVMTAAIAEAFLQVDPAMEDGKILRLVRDSLLLWGRRHPRGDYGVRFQRWLVSPEPAPYGSFGNGAAMRVSPVGWLFDDLPTVRRMARLSAAPTHDHPEGLKGAEATASVIFLARTGVPKAQIRAYVEGEFGYDLSRTCDQIRPGYHHVESCQETVPEAITAFLEGECFEDVIRTAVSLGGDCDTLTAIAGSMGEAFYGVPEELKTQCRGRLSADLLQVLDRFWARVDRVGHRPAFFRLRSSQLALRYCSRSIL